MSLETADKDPDAQLRYQIDWTAYAGGNAIATSAWVVPAGLTKVSEAVNGFVTEVELSAGAAGKSYRVTNRITFADGSIDDRSFTLRVVER